MIGWLRERPQWWAYLAVAVMHLLLLAAGHPWAAVTQPLLAPALVPPALRVRRPLRTWVVIALAFSWLGDTLPKLVAEPNAFMAMTASFLLAQLIWVTGLGNRWAYALPARRPATSALYLVAAVSIVGSCIPFAGPFGPVVVLYAAALTAAAILTTSMGERGIWGGALFMLSGALIAMGAFIPWFRFEGLDVLIMFTYICAQALLVAGAARIRDPRNPRLGDTL
ncbi:hypothetical protein GCM10027418_17400 [Mariniluteicoccus endophyticus]